MLVIYLAFNSILGLGGSFRSYNAVASTEQPVLKLDEVDGLVLDGEVAKIRGEFEAAKQGFLMIPEAVKGMPKMNPEGAFHDVLAEFLFYLFMAYCNVRVFIILV